MQQLFHTEPQWPHCWTYLHGRRWNGVGQQVHMVAVTANDTSDQLSWPQCTDRHTVYMYHTDKLDIECTSEVFAHACPTRPR